MPLYIADFETTVEDDTTKQTKTEVWAYGLSKMFDGTENVDIGNCIEDFFISLCKGPRNRKKIIYFTNLKFDGSFIIDYLARILGFKASYDENEKVYSKENELPRNTFSCVITDLGIWYNIIVNFNGYILEFRDTLKLLNYSVKDLGPAFDCKHRKLEIDYKGNMHAGGEITPEQRMYITNDILVPKEAMEKFLTEINCTKYPPLTISQWALKTFKSQFTKEEWENMFPNLLEIKLDKAIWGSDNADEYIRKSYLGGWCYCDERFTGLINGLTKVYDVNSLYPSVMRDHKNVMPIGKPYFTKDVRDLTRCSRDCYYFIRFKCQFSLKAGYLPFIQLKHDVHYRSNENLKRSKYDMFGENLGNYKPEITLSKTLFNLFCQCYDVKDLEVLDLCIFNSEAGLFDSYVDHFVEMKIKNNKNKVKRNTAKLGLNSIYGRFARNPENCFKVPVCNDEGDIIDYKYDEGPNNEPLYIPVASAITSYARLFTVRAAINNQKYFRYSDTDSLHICPPDDDYIPVGMEIHDTKLSCWKEETVAAHSKFVRQKTYIEWTDNDYDIKACGMPDRCKMLTQENLRGNIPNADDCIIVDDKEIKLSPKEVRFLWQERTVEDFRHGFSVPGKLLPKLVTGGTVLQEVDFTIN